MTTLNSSPTSFAGQYETISEPRKITPYSRAISSCELPFRWINSYNQIKTTQRMEFTFQSPDVEWGTLLSAFEKAHELERHVNDQLLTLHWEAQEKNDPHVRTTYKCQYVRWSFMWTRQNPKLSSVASFCLDKSVTITATCLLNWATLTC